jgi:hypothetical protein
MDRYEDESGVYLAEPESRMLSIPSLPTENGASSLPTEERLVILDIKVQRILDIMEGLQKALGAASQHPMLGAFFGGIGS